jgi:hypothetical protein
MSPFLRQFRFLHQDRSLVHSFIQKVRVVMSWKTTVLLVSLAVASAAAAPADRIVPPVVPGGLDAPVGTRAFFEAHAVGTQNYICAPAGTATGLDWLFIGPQATLFDESGEQVATHFHSRNPDATGAIQATWQSSKDSSAVWAVRHAGSLDANFVAPGAIEWLLLDVSGDENGPNGGNKLSTATHIQRVNTVGGAKPPSSECTASTLNTRRLVSYQADYYFYR